MRRLTVKLAHPPYYEAGQPILLETVAALTIQMRQREVSKLIYELARKLEAGTETIQVELEVVVMAESVMNSQDKGHYQE